MTQNRNVVKYGGIFADLYRSHIRKFIRKELSQQRLKLIYDVWWYWPLLKLKALKFSERIKLLCKLIRIDWYVLLGSKPAEVTPVLIDILRRRAQDGEAFVEAGCWNGGSSAKFSIACKMYGYKLHVYDSFQGVKEWNYMYAARETDVRDNIAKYGELSVCTFHSGWFKDTLWNQPVPFPVRLVYIDCDVLDGTLEVLSGVLPSLVKDGVIYSQDYHLRNVRETLNDPKTWTKLGAKVPTVQPLILIRYIARMSWETTRQN